MFFNEEAQIAHIYVKEWEDEQGKTNYEYEGKDKLFLTPLVGLWETTAENGHPCASTENGSGAASSSSSTQPG